MREWRDAPGYECYQVSNEGRVKSLARDIVYKNGRIRHYDEKLLKPLNNGGGYLIVNLYKDRKSETKYIHKLVAEAFIPNPLNLPQVNHKDECKTNNRVWLNEDGSVNLEKSNLEWCTCKENINHGTHNQRVAEANTNGKRSKRVYQYTLEGELVAIWSSINECGRDGFNKGAVSDCCNNKYIREGNNIYKGFRWSYVPL